MPPVCHKIIVFAISLERTGKIYEKTEADIATEKDFANFKRFMKYKIIQIAAVLLLLVVVSSCHKPYATDRKVHKFHYRGGGRGYW